MNYDIYVNAAPGSILHAKPVPFTSPWASDTILFTEDAIYGGNFKAELDEDTRYLVYYGDPNTFEAFTSEERHLRTRTSIAVREEQVAAEATPPPGLFRVDLLITSTQALPLENVSVRIDGGQATQPAPTDAQGLTFFYAAEGAYTVAVNARGYNLASEALTVSGDATATLTVSPDIGQASAPNQTLAHTTCFNGQGLPAANLKVTFQLLKVEDGDESGEAYSRTPFEVSADAAGYLLYT